MDDLDPSVYAVLVAEACNIGLSPLVHAHINRLDRYHFTVPEAVLRGELRPLRDPNDGAASA